MLYATSYEPMEVVSKRNEMQALYAEAEIKFIEALFRYKGNRREDEAFYEAIGRVIALLEKACSIASRGGYKEFSNLAMFKKSLDVIYDQFKSQVTHRTSATEAGDSPHQHSTLPQLYTSGVDNLSSS